MTILVLGGTSDARQLIKGLESAGIMNAHTVIYSVAGKVRIPELNCPVITGGFTQFGGLTTYLQDNKVELLLDFTHPFAEKISQSAVTSAKATGIPCWRFERPSWEPTPADRWWFFEDRDALFKAAEPYQSVLLTAGQLTQQESAPFAKFHQSSGQRQVLRTAVAPEHPLPVGMSWHQAIGPFDLASETALLEEHKVDLIISKNSGGYQTESKLMAARTLGIPVFLLQRPVLASADQTFQQIDTCVQSVCAWTEGQG